MKLPRFLIAISILMMFSSCVTQRKVEYLQDSNKNFKAFKEAELPDYRLKPNDELYIQINSLDEAAANVFSAGKEQSYYVGTMQPYGACLLYTSPSPRDRTRSRM